MCNEFDIVYSNFRALFPGDDLHFWFGVLFLVAMLLLSTIPPKIL
jgi:hypothetical protein